MGGSRVLGPQRWGLGGVIQRSIAGDAVLPACWTAEPSAVKSTPSPWPFQSAKAPCPRASGAARCGRTVFSVSVCGQLCRFHQRITPSARGPQAARPRPLSCCAELKGSRPSQVPACAMRLLRDLGTLGPARAWEQPWA